MKPASAAVLILLLGSQGGCYDRSDPLGVPVPGSVAAQAIREADRVEVTTRSGRKYELGRAEVDSTAIRGVVHHSDNWRLEIPLDSIADTQVVTMDGLRTTLVSVTMALVTLGLILEAGGGLEPTSRTN